MFYVVSAAVLLIIVGIFTLDIIKIIIGLVVVIIAFLIFRSKINKATKDPILFEMHRSIIDLNKEIINKIWDEKKYSSSDNKYSGIILLIHIGFIKAASSRSPISDVKFKDLFYAVFNAIDFTLKRDTIDSLYQLHENLSKYEMAGQIILIGVKIYTYKLYNKNYLDYCLEKIDELYKNPQTPNSIADYFNTTSDIEENNIKNKNQILNSNSNSNSDHTKMEEAESIYNLGVMYANGIDVEKDDKKAIELWKEAAHIGYPLAHYNLGNWYFHGRVVKQSYEKAVEHYKEAANSGLLESINNLANCYMHGLGVHEDKDEAVKLYKEASDRGFAESQNNLGACYFHGDGVEKNLSEAIKWYKKAAIKDHPEAQCNLGICYADGVGVDKSLNEAHKWFKIASENGEERAREGLVMVESELSVIRDRYRAKYLKYNIDKKRHQNEK